MLFVLHTATHSSKKRFRGCQGQFIKAHSEANEVVKFYKEISRGKCTWLKDPSIEELDKCLNEISDSKSDSQAHEAVLIYYIGHGVEHENRTHAVLKQGDQRVKYDLEAMANKIGWNRLVHAMFDCNRFYLNHLPPTQKKVYSTMSSYLFTYATHAGRETKAIGASKSYVEHMRK